jgi:hypothetical protein
MLRFNDMEYEKLGNICKLYHLDISKRGTISPLLRRLVLNQETEEKDILPDPSNLAYHFNKIGNNINQLVKLAHHKSLKSPNSNLQYQIRKTNELLSALLEIINKE